LVIVTVNVVFDPIDTQPGGLAVETSYSKVAVGSDTAKDILKSTPSPAQKTLLKIFVAEIDGSGKGETFTVTEADCEEQASGSIVLLAVKALSYTITSTKFPVASV